MKILHTVVTINVRELNRSVSFYESIGFSLKQKWGDHYAMVTASGIEVGLHPSNDLNKPEGHSGVSIGFTTEDLEDTKDELTRNGIAFTERNEEGGEFLHFTDPDGTQLYFIRPKW